MTFSIREFFNILWAICLSYSLAIGQNVTSSQADSLYQQGQFAEAAHAYHLLSEKHSTDDSIARFQYWEAKCYIQQYQFEKARTLLQQATHNISSTPTEDLLSKVYHEIAYTYMGEGALEDASHFNKKSIDTESGRALVDSLQLSKYFELKAFIFLQSGKYEEAERWIYQAHQVKQRVLDPVDKELGYSANTLFIILSALGKQEPASKAIAEAWSILQHHLPEEHPHIAVIANNYSTLLMDMGDPLQARDYLLKAIASNRKGERHLLLAQNHVNLGLLYLNLRESKTAESYYQQAWEIADTLISYPDYQRANIQDALGAVYYQQGLHVKADSMFRMALKEKEDLYEEEGEEIAQSFFNLGLIAEEKKDWHRAKKYFNSAEQIRKQVFGFSHPKRADVLYEQATINWEMKNKETAMALWEEALSIYKAKFGLAHQHTQGTMLQLAQANSLIKHSDIIQNILKSAWAGICGLDTPLDNLEQLDSLEIKQYYPEVLDLINFHVTTILKDKQFQNEEEVHTAYRIFSMVQAWLPTFQSLYNDATLYEGVSDQLQLFYRLFALLAHHEMQDKKVDQQKWINLLLQCIQASRGVTVQAAFQDRQAVQFADVPDTLIAESQNLKKQLRFALARQERLDAEDEESNSELVLQQQKILQSWQELQQAIKVNFPNYYESRYAVVPLTIAEVQDGLAKEQSQWVAYFDLDTALLAIHLKDDQIQSHFLMMSKGWQDSIFQYQQILQNPLLYQKKTILGYELYKQLWEPLHIPDEIPVKILADGALHYLNFETLLSDKPEGGRSMSTWPWLLKKYHIYYGQSLTIGNSETKTHENTILGIAPGFSPDLKARYRQKLLQGAQEDTVFTGWLRTPWSLAFVQQIGEKGWGQSLTEEYATESMLFKEAPRAGILHFGTHAFIQNDAPLNSYLALTPDPSMQEDGYLHAYELYGREVDAQLAVLTACETGLGRLKKGDGVLSLAHAFRYAGCPGVIYSLWSIDDQQSNQLVMNFYTNLEEDMPVAEALRQAKLKYLTDAKGPMQSPYYWGSLVFTGENTTIPLNKNHSLVWLILAGVMLIPLLFVAFRHAKKR